MQRHEIESPSRDSEDGKTNCNNCLCDQERQMWYQWYQDYVIASEERYKKKIQSLRSSCRQQVRNLVVKLHKEYKVGEQNLREDYEKKLASLKSTFMKKNTELKNSLRMYENDIKPSRKSKTSMDIVMLSDSDSEESNGNKIHEKCQNTYQLLQSLLDEKEDKISEITQELEEVNLLLSEKQQMCDDLIIQDKEYCQQNQRELKTTSIQTEILYNQEINRHSKMANLKIVNLNGLSIPQDPTQDLILDKLKQKKKNFQAILASKDNTLKELQEKIDKLEAELEKCNNVNEDLHQRVKLLQKRFNPDQPSAKPREINRSGSMSKKHMKKIWEKKIAILQESLHTLRNEMYLRQTLEKQATMLHRANINYTGRPETPEEPLEAKLIPSNQNPDNQLPAKTNTMLPVIQDINQELSMLLEAHGWWKK